MSQIWAQMVAQDVAAWFSRVASVVLALGLIAFVREAPALLSSSLRVWTYLTAIALVIVPVLGIVQRTDPMAEELLSALTGLVLVPVWAVWLGRAVDLAPGAASA